MNIGMLWFSPDRKQPFEQRLAVAVKHYSEKYGHAPDTCYIHPDGQHPQTVGGVQIRESRTVQTGHFLIGVAE